jgi:NitT/TauT family transport system substrate-binding protein
MKLKSMVIALGFILSHPALAGEKPLFKIGVQTAGTLDWELSVLPKSDDFDIQVQIVATAEAAKIALQSGAVDMIVSDWLWVSQARQTGAEFTLYPYSAASGALVVPADSTIQRISDLAGKRLGIVGGELDKNWLLLQAVAQKDAIDLNAKTEKTFGAPPLMSEQLKNKRVDAILTYWHFAAQLQAQGYKQLLDGKALQEKVGIQETVPTLGYVFKESWANTHKTALTAFFKATAQAKNNLCSDDTLWQKTTTKMPFSPPVLRERYCEGRLNTWTISNQQAAQQLYSALYQLNPKVGTKPELSQGTFWTAE